MKERTRKSLPLQGLLLACLYHLSFAGVPDVNAAPLPLVQQSDMKYLGAFRMPASVSGFAYSQGTIAYNSKNNSLFIVGSTNAPSSTSNNYVAEISIPALVNSPNVLSLPFSTLLQPLTDITEGNRYNIGANGSIHGVTNGVRLGGLLLHSISGVNKLIGSVYSYYDGSQTAVRSHFVSGTTLATTGDFQGMYKVGVTPSPVPQAGFIAGYMAKVPADWQTALGGPVLTGKAGIPIISRTSYGPSAFVFDPAKLTGTPADASPVAASPLVYYDLGHQSLGVWSETGPSNQYVSLSDNVTGLVFPDGSKSILFFGRHGTRNCYGPGTSILSEDGNKVGMTCQGGDGGVVVGETNTCCYDPFQIYTKGTHGYPVKPYVWAYSADDFALVRAGTKKPWEILPYGVWEFTFPTTTYNGQTKEFVVGGAAYDPATRRLFITQSNIDGNDPKPIVHVYEIQNLNAPLPAPTNLKGTLAQ